MDKRTVARSSEGGTVASLLPRMASCHGLIAGATGTGKTIPALPGKAGNLLGALAKSARMPLAVRQGLRSCVES